MSDFYYALKLGVRDCFHCRKFRFFLLISSRHIRASGFCFSSAQRKRETMVKAQLLYLWWCSLSSGWKNTERQLYHDVLIIQWKLCFSFLTVCFSSALLLCVVQYSSRHDSKFLHDELREAFNVGTSVESCINAFMVRIKDCSMSKLCSCFYRHTQWKLFCFQWGLILLCVGFAALRETFPVRFGDLRWHFQQFLLNRAFFSRETWMKEVFF